jgi:hypothetical protein
LILVPPFTDSSEEGNGNSGEFPFSDASGASGKARWPMSVEAFASLGRLSHQNTFAEKIEPTTRMINKSLPDVLTFTAILFFD